MSTATKESKKAPVIVSMLGGQYDAECGPDGKYSIKDIEFFSTHAKGENGVDFNVTDEKIREMYAAIMHDAKAGHLLPVNVFHHNDPQHPDVRQIAYFMPRSLKNSFVNGRDRLTIFGDIVGISSYDFDSMRDVKYPYRSAQVLSFKNNRFSAMSLLKDQVGFFTYPLLTVGSVSYTGSSPSLPQPMESALVGYRAEEDADSMLFCYAFGSNDKKKKKDDSKKKSDKPGSSDDKGKGFDKKRDGEDGDEQDSAEGEEGEGGEEVEGGEESASDTMSTDEKIDKIYAIVLQISKDVSPSQNDVNGDKSPSQDKGSRKTYSAKEDDVSTEKKQDGVQTPAVPPAPAAPAAPAPEKKSDPVADANYAALADRTAKLEHKAATKDREAAAIKELEEAGFTRLTKATKDKVAQYAAEGESGLRIFLDTYKLHADKDPAETVDGDKGKKVEGVHVAKHGEVPELAEYAAKNPTDKAGISLRAKLWPEYQAYKAQGGSIQSFDRYVAAEKNAMALRASAPPQEE